MAKNETFNLVAAVGRGEVQWSILGIPIAVLRRLLHAPYALAATVAVVNRCQTDRI